MTAELTERRQLILKLVVQEFVESATAVASDTLVRKYGLPVSSATVRNELAVLEEMGYLTHLHTSAGRVPTDVGYRFFVENLMDFAPLSFGEQQIIRHQLYQVRSEIDQWIQLGATVLARTAQNASVVTPPQAFKARFKHVELVAVYEMTVLMVLVLNDATVRQQTFTLDTAHNKEDLRRVSMYMNERCEGCTVERLQTMQSQENSAHPPHLRDLEQQVLELVMRAMRQFEEHMNRQIYSDGLIEMLRQPEFLPALLKEEDVNRAVERLRQVLETLTSNSALSTLVLQALASDGVKVVIGAEHGIDELRDYSVVLSRYGDEDTVAGVLGVIGPTRMSYPRSISIVTYISGVMSDLVTNIYGGNTASNDA